MRMKRLNWYYQNQREIILFTDRAHVISYIIISGKPSASVLNELAIVKYLGSTYSQKILCVQPFSDLFCKLFGDSGGWPVLGVRFERVQVDLLWRGGYGLGGSGFWCWWRRRGRGSLLRSGVVRWHRSTGSSFYASSWSWMFWISLEILCSNYSLFYPRMEVSYMDCTSNLWNSVERAAN